MSARSASPPEAFCGTWFECVGKRFKAFSIKNEKPATYLCVNYDPRLGLMMQNVDDVDDQRCVSERAVGRTYYYDVMVDIDPSLRKQAIDRWREWHEKKF